MSHAHLSVRHLLQQLEDGRPGRSGRMRLPEWLQTFITAAAERFDPEAEAARAGYVCSFVDDAWVVTLFLGVTEVVGGADDGASLPTGFTFDLQAISGEFDRIDRILWRALPAGCLSNCSPLDDASVLIEGEIQGQRLALQVVLRPPAAMGPGLLRDAEGRCTPAS